MNIKIKIDVEDRATISVMSLETLKMAELGDDTFGNLVFIYFLMTVSKDKRFL